MDIEKAVELCICGMCPTYFDCGEKLAFCMEEVGKSKCIEVENGCICPDCPVQVDMHFQHEYYCTRGSERAITSAVK